jgi:uncharacterized membrane protein
VLEIEMMRAFAQAFASRIAGVRSDERGEVTEKVIMTAIFAALAIAAGAIIVAKVTAKANSIPTD